jgi:TetR/AcrR family transcriptional regulator, cholesterol catabolism regulator
MPRPRGHGANYEVKRQEIIDLAAELFAKRGYAATGIAELGDVVGLAKGALYYYIGSKENLLVEIQARVMRPLLAAARQIAQLDLDPVLRLRLLSETLLTNILRRLEHIWVYEHDYRHLAGENRSRFLRQRRDFEKIVAGLLSEAMDAKAFRAMDIHLATLQFLNLHNHTYQWVRPDGKWTAATLSAEYCCTLFGGFRTDTYDPSCLEEQIRQFRAANPELNLLAT